jgi:multidrug resistance protein MdtO
MPVSVQDYLRKLVGLLRPQPGRNEFALRLALTCALTVLVAEIYQTPEPALTAYIVFFLNREDRASSLILNMVFLLLITVVIAFVIAAARVVADDPMWRVVSMTVISFCLLFLASASKLRPIGGTVALIVGYALDELGVVRLGEEATRGYLYAWLFVSIPVGVSMATNLLLSPAPRRLAERAIAYRLKLAAVMLRVPDEDTRRRFRECLAEGSGQIQSWLNLALREQTSSATDVAALRQAADSTLVLLSAIDVADRNPEAPLPDPLREYLAQTLDKMASMMTTGYYPIEIAWQSPDEGPLLCPLAEIVHAEIKNAVVNFSVVPNLAAQLEEKPKKRRGFFEEDAFTNSEHIHYAVKTTAGAMLCYALYSLLDWSGIHTSFITCYIVSLGTTAETVEKLTLRIVGCLIGAAAGIAAIVFVVPSLTSIDALMAIVFVGAYAAAYVAVGSPRISYAGFQIAFAFFLCVVQGPAPAFDMEVARDRVIGILLGNLVIYVLFTNFWPISVARRIDPAIATLLRKLGEMMRAANPWTRRAVAATARAALAAIETDIDLAAYEPRGVRPSGSWLAIRRSMAQEIAAIESPLLLSADQELATSAHIANRLETLAGRFTPADRHLSSPHGYPQEEWSNLPLFRIIDPILRGLEQTSE